MKFLKRILPDFVVERRYIRAGSDFGDMVSYIYLERVKDLNNSWISGKNGRKNMLVEVIGQ